MINRTVIIYTMLLTIPTCAMQTNLHQVTVVNNLMYSAIIVNNPTQCSMKGQARTHYEPTTINISQSQQFQLLPSNKISTLTILIPHCEQRVVKVNITKNDEIIYVSDSPSQYDNSIIILNKNLQRLATIKKL